MATRALTRAEFDALAGSTIAWAQQILADIAKLRTREASLLGDARNAVLGRTFVLGGDRPPPSGLLADIIVVPVPPGSAVVPVDKMVRRYVSWRRIAGPVLEHADDLAASLAALTDAARTPSRGISLRRHGRPRQEAAVDALRELADWGYKTGFARDLDLLQARKLPDAEEGWIPAVATVLGVPQPPDPVPVRLAARDLRTLLEVVERPGLLEGLDQTARGELTELAVALQGIRTGEADLVLLHTGSPRRGADVVRLLSTAAERIRGAQVAVASASVGPPAYPRPAEDTASERRESSADPIDPFLGFRVPEQRSPAGPGTQD